MLVRDCPRVSFCIYSYSATSFHFMFIASFLLGLLLTCFVLHQYINIKRSGRVCDRFVFVRAGLFYFRASVVKRSECGAFCPGFSRRHRHIKTKRDLCIQKAILCIYFPLYCSASNKITILIGTVDKNTFRHVPEVANVVDNAFCQ